MPYSPSTRAARRAWRRPADGLLLVLSVLLALGIAWQAGRPALARQANLDTPETPEPLLPIPLTTSLDPARVALGARLFHDVRLSGHAERSCATCHPLARGGADGQSWALADSPGVRNTPTVFNVSLNFLWQWDGTVPTLEAQAERVLLRPERMGITWPILLARLQAEPAYRTAFQTLYPGVLQREHVLDALATYERSLLTPDSRFDQYLRGASQALAAAELQGYQLFKAYGCVACHQGRNVGGNMVQKFGIFQTAFTALYPTASADLGRLHRTQVPRDRGVFRVPSLRNVAVTVPYFHDGRAPTLEAAVDTMARVQLGQTLTADEVGLIVQFLHTLTGAYEGRSLAAPPGGDTLMRTVGTSLAIVHAETVHQMAQQYYGQVDAQAQRARVLLYVAAFLLVSYGLALCVQLWMARQRLAAQTREQKLQLIQANKMTFLGTLVSCVAHEVNNPNQLLMANAPILASAWQDAEPILDAYHQKHGDFLLGELPYTEMRALLPVLVHDVYDGAQRIARMVNDLRDFARPQSHGIQAPFSLNETVQRALRLLRHLIQQKTVHCCVTLAADLPLLRGTPQHIEQVIVNLVVNALEALPDSGYGVTIATALAAPEPGVVLTVQDEGVGIIPEHLLRLCEPFFTTKQGSGGTGLGLAIAATLVHAHGGQLRFVSTPGQGTCAQVTLPCEPQAARDPTYTEVLEPASEESALL